MSKDHTKNRVKEAERKIKEPSGKVVNNKVLEPKDKPENNKLIRKP